MTRPRSFHEEFPITAFLLLFNLAFYCLEFVANKKIADGDPGFWQISGTVLVRLGSLFPPKVESGEYWRLISATFLHGGILHLFFNCMFLHDVGRLSEPLLSRWRYLTVYAASGLGGSLASYLIKGQHSVGASGALCGLVGALFAFSVRHGQQLLRESLTRVIVWIVILSFLPFIDWAGHAGGFAVGLVFGWCTAAYTTSTMAARWRYPGFVAALVVGSCLAMALRNYFF